MAINVDAIIEAAIRKGELDDLPGKGKPLNLADESGIHPEDRMTYHILGNAGIVPPEVEMFGRLEEMREELKGLTDPAARKTLATEISALESLHKMKLEHARRR